jgi:hypothetical protein
MLKQSLGHFRELRASWGMSLVATARNSLGEEAFATVWAEGQAMTLDHAVAYALEEAAPA